MIRRSADCQSLGIAQQRRAGGQNWQTRAGNSLTRRKREVSFFSFDNFFWLFFVFIFSYVDDVDRTTKLLSKMNKNIPVHWNFSRNWQNETRFWAWFEKWHCFKKFFFLLWTRYSRVLDLSRKSRAIQKDIISKYYQIRGRSAQERIFESSSLFETVLNSLVIIFFLLHIVFYTSFSFALC